MKTPVGYATFFALVVLILSPWSVGHAAPQPADSVHFCQYYQLDHPQPAAKRLAAPSGVAPRMVRMIYFSPKDSPFRQSMADSMKAHIRQVQTLYAKQMKAHGYGKKTFRFETDAQGEPLVLHVTGQHSQSYYSSALLSVVLSELGPMFDHFSVDLYLITVDFTIAPSYPIAIGAWYGKNGGVAVQSIGLSSSFITGHELGHVFGLDHDFSNNDYLMSYGGKTSLSAGDAEFLAVHPSFNSSSSVRQKVTPSIKPISSLTYPAGSASVPIEIEVGSSNGLHQVRLRGITRGARVYEVIAWRGLAGEKKAVVKFEYDGTLPSSSASFSDYREHPLGVFVVDTDGNVGRREFKLEEDRSVVINEPVDLPVVNEPVEPSVVNEPVEPSVESPVPYTLTKVSGDGQVGQADTALSDPLVVSVSDQNGKLFVGAVVRFAVVAGGGTLSDTTYSTGSNGRAHSTLTLGRTPGLNTVVATVAGLDTVTFTATTAGVVNEPVDPPVVNEPVDPPVANEPVEPSVESPVPYTLTKVSGDGQVGQADTALSDSLVVSVSDQNGKLFVGAVVRFAVTAGGGTLSDTTVSTGSNGRAHSTLTLGRAPGLNTVVATVAGLDTVAFTATATAPGILPDRLVTVAGDGQAGLAGAQLAAPLVVSVLDENNEFIAGAVVRFAVTAGGGHLSATHMLTDAQGRARTFLRLGPDPGTNTVAATVADLDTVLTFTATGQESKYAGFDDFFARSKQVARPSRTELRQNAPNPFNSETVVSYFLLEPGPVRLEVFALSGQRVALLYEGLQSAGYHRLHWDVADARVASGMYLYRLVTADDVLTRKLVLLR